MRRRITRKLFFWLYLVAVTALMAVAVEFAAMRYNRAQGIELPFLVPDHERSELRTLQHIDQFTLLDPHLGYAHGENEGNSHKVESAHSRLPGFIVYGDRAGPPYERPIIVALGGSTTDPVMYGHSWPEELSKILVERKVSGTVINGGVGGYSSSQELLKLVRDVIELEPDIVLSYNGINDINSWAPLPTPMVHTYQRRVFDYVLNQHDRTSPLFPNATRMFSHLLQLDARRSGVSGVTYGIETKRSTGEFLVRNIDIMHHVAQGMGISYLSFLQPVAAFGDYTLTDEDKAGLARYADDFLPNVQSTFSTGRKAAAERDYMIDLTNIFAGHQGVYRNDAVHLTQKGNRLVAQSIYDVLQERDLVGGTAAE